MIYRMATYKIKGDKLAEVTSAIEEMTAAVALNEPETVFYSAYRIGQTLEFVHVMGFRSDEAEEFHRTSDHVKQFTESLYPNCEATPEFSELEPVGPTR